MYQPLLFKVNRVLGDRSIGRSIQREAWGFCKLAYNDDTPVFLS